MMVGGGGVYEGDQSEGRGAAEFARPVVVWWRGFDRSQDLSPNAGSRGEARRSNRFTWPGPARIEWWGEKKERNTTNPIDSYESV